MSGHEAVFASNLHMRKVSGNGGKMNATKEKLVVLDKKEKAKPTGSKRKKNTGAAKMRQVADEVVGRECGPIIDALSANGKKGQILSAKFLYDLAHTAEEDGEGEGAEDFRNLALELATSPEWQGVPRKTSADEEDEEIED